MNIFNNITSFACMQTCICTNAAVRCINSASALTFVFVYSVLPMTLLLFFLKKITAPFLFPVKSHILRYKIDAISYLRT